MEKRNICDECLNCEGRNEYSLTDCFELCYHPVDALHEIEKKRNEQEKKRPCKHAVLKKGKWECSQFGKIDCEYQDEDFTCIDYVTKEKEINAIYCTKGDKRK